MDNYKDFNARELALKHARLMEEVEQSPPGIIVNPETHAEINKLQAELYERLDRFMEDYPLCIRVPAPLRRDLEFVEHQKVCRKQIEKPVRSGIKIKFFVTVISPFGCKAAEFSVEADSKAEADILARKQIRKLGLQGTSHKIR